MRWVRLASVLASLAVVGCAVVGCVALAIQAYESRAVAQIEAEAGAHRGQRVVKSVDPQRADEHLPTHKTVRLLGFECVDELSITVNGHVLTVGMEDGSPLCFEDSGVAGWGPSIAVPDGSALLIDLEPPAAGFGAESTNGTPAWVCDPIASSKIGVVTSPDTHSWVVLPEIGGQPLFIVDECRFSGARHVNQFFVGQP